MPIDASAPPADPGASPVAPAAKEIDPRPLSVVALLAAFLLIAGLWAFAAPLPALSLTAAKWDGFNPDEFFHLRYIAWLAQHHSLPPLTGPEGVGIYTAVHPPLYYLVAAPLFAALSAFLPLGQVVIGLRLFGCLIGAGTVYLTFRAARILLPHYGALLAAGFVAGVPMFVSLSAAVSNEVPAAFAATGALYVMAAGLRHGFTKRHTLALALWVAAGLAIKITCLALLPAACLAFVLAARRQRNSSGSASAYGQAARQTMAVVGASVALIGWWFVRNALLYGDPLMAAAHVRLWGAGSASWRPNLTEGQFYAATLFVGWQSFWGIFDAFTRPLPDAAYAAIAALQLPATAGFFLFLRRRAPRGSVRREVAAVYGLFALVLIVLFFAVNHRFYSPQGRYLFPMLLPFGLASAAGWLGLVTPRRRRPAAAKARALTAGVLLFALLMLGLFAFATMSVRPDSSPQNTPLPATPAPS